MGREAEIVKLRKDVEEANIASESVLSNLKRKQGDATLEMQEQIDALAKMKAKIEKDKQSIMAEISDARAATDEVVRSQASADKANKGLVENLNAINKKVDAANLTLGDFGMSKNKIANENGELLRIVGDLENNLNMLAKAKAALAAQLNDIKALCDNEARERQLLLGKYRNLEHELDLAKEALDEEAAGRDNILRLNAKAEGDAAAMRQKYETDAVAKAEELEMTKMKLSARNTEAEAAIDNLNAKLAQVEKAKGKIQNEITEMSTNLDQAQVVNAAMERKAKQFDKTITEMKGKVDRLSFDLDVSQMELTQVKAEINRRIAEKDEEFAMVRKNQTKALDSMQSALETEAKGKAEALRMKKKLEADSGDLGLALEHAIAGSAETQNTIKKYQLQVRDAQVKVDAESQSKSAAADAKVTADRKAAAMQNCLEESRALLETADR